MKLDQLITQFLYSQKKLSLPGIGTFTTDGAEVKFSNTADPAISEELIDFVHTHTGKMKSLALSDLESYIMLNTQFLNIGKALHLEGIGTLVKNKEGKFDFTPGELVPERMEDLITENRKPSVFKEETRATADNNLRQKWFIGLLGLLSLVIIVWGGWRLFLNNSNPEKEVILPIVDTAQTIVQDTISTKRDSATVALTDSIPAAQSSASSNMATAANSQWKYIIEETANKNRAYKRFNQLKELGSTVQLSTVDSARFKLYFVLPGMVSDTARIRDSLKRFYGSRRVFVAP